MSRWTKLHFHISVSLHHRRDRNAISEHIHVYICVYLCNRTTSIKPHASCHPRPRTLPHVCTCGCTSPAGFLGAGKTSLVQHVLTAEHGYRIAVILNEYGEDTGIESSVVKGKEASEGREGRAAAWVWRAGSLADGTIV